MPRFAPLVIAALLCVPEVAALAQEAVEQKPEEVRLKLSAAPEPRPALKYSFWLSRRERQPGNGATFYYRAMLHRQSNAEATDKQFPPEKISQWSQGPIGEMPVKEVASYLEMHRTVFDELRTATTREKCEWDLRLEQLQGTEVVSLLLHDFQQMRDLGRLLALKARYEVATGKTADAIASLRMGYQLAHDTAEPPLLINALLGMAVAAQMNAVTLELMQTPAAPNLYWAMKQLPHPLIDMRPSLEFEMSIPYRVFPYLTDAETAQRTPQEWQRLTQETLTNLNSLSSDTQHRLNDWQVRLGATALMIKAYPLAKQQLLDEGRDKEAVERMPVAQVIAIHAARNYRVTYDEVFKWALVPFPEGYAQMQASLERLKREGYIGQPFSDNDVLPIASVLMPSVESVMIASARSERRLAVLETIEALRMQATQGEQVLPGSLSELAVTAPPNPFTGKAFEYKLEDGLARLIENAPGLDPVRTNDRIYLIEFQKPATK